MLPHQGVILIAAGSNLIKMLPHQGVNMLRNSILYSN